MWVTWIEMPWVGMETEACPFLDGGNGCQPDAAVRDIYISINVIIIISHL